MMHSLEISDYDSETCDSFDEVIESGSTDNLLNFCSKVTDELKHAFRKNFGSDDCCEDIYEDKFTTPKSGSYSYYADILAVAQLNEKSRVLDSSRITQRKTTESLRAVYPSDWRCSGRCNPEIGMGPLEELFQVLQHQNGISRTQHPWGIITHATQDWPMSSSLPATYDENLIGIDSIDSDYSSFIDVFHRWNNNSFISTNIDGFASNEYPMF